MKRNILFFIMMFAAGLPSPVYAYQLALGDLHSHTSFSDGKGIPDEAYDMARNQAGLQFWSVTDHEEQIGVVTTDPPGAKRKEWDVMRQSARDKTANGKFVGLAGFEWGMDEIQGHINVLHTDAVPKRAELLNLNKFYRWVYKHPEAVFGFNHPSDHPGVFKKMEYVPQVASQAFYIAVNVDEDLQYYYMALDNGWRIGPSAQQDNHSKNWGLHENGNLTGAYINEISSDGLLDAFENRRIYATNDKNLKVWLDADGQPMGSALAADDAVTLHFNVTHDSGALIASVRIITNTGSVAQEWQPNQAAFTSEYKAAADAAGVRWFVVLARDANGRRVVSAPIWVKKE